MAFRTSGLLARRRVRVALAIVVLGGAVSAVAVANAALLGVAGSPQDEVGGLSARMGGAAVQRPVVTTAPLVATAPAATTEQRPAATTSAATTTARPAHGVATSPAGTTAALHVQPALVDPDDEPGAPRDTPLNRDD